MNTKTTKNTKATKATTTTTSAELSPIEMAYAKIVEGNKDITKAKLEAYLTLEDFSKADIGRLLKSKGIVGAKPVSFASGYYSYLSEAKRTEAEATAYILGTDGNEATSDNVQKHKSHYLGVYNLSVAIWDAK